MSEVFLFSFLNGGLLLLWSSDKPATTELLVHQWHLFFILAQLYFILPIINLCADHTEVDSCQSTCGCFTKTHLSCQKPT